MKRFASLNWKSVWPWLAHRRRGVFPGQTDRPMRKLHGIIAAGLVSFACVSAFGQTYKNFDVELNEIRSGARLRLGPFRFVPDFRLTNVGYDDNVYFRGLGEKAVGDYTGTVSPEVRAYLLLGRSLILSLTENPEYQYFAHETPLRRFTNSFSSGARLRLFNRLVFSGNYHFLKHQRRASSEFASLVTDTGKGTKLSAFYETPRGSAIGLSQAVERFLYEDIILPDSEILLSRSLNRKETTGTAEFYYPVFAESFFFLTTGSTTYEFADPSYQWRDSRSFQITSGIRFPFMGRARGTLSLGYKKFTPKSKDQKSFSGLIADTNLDFRIRAPRPADQPRTRQLFFLSRGRLFLHREPPEPRGFLSPDPALPARL